MKFKGKTSCIHSGELKDLEYKGAVSPLYMSTSYAFDDVDSNRYPRYFNTPNQTALGKKISILEKGEKALIFSSGMAAISSSLFSNLESGSHVIFQNDLYGGTSNFIKKQFPKYGIEFSFSKGLGVSDFEKEIKQNTVGIYIETPSNPLFKIINLKEVSKLAKDRDCWTIVDNTFASPVNQNPISFGIDMVVHSATKYLGGHSDISAGVVVSNNFFIEKIYDHAKNFGGNLSEKNNLIQVKLTTAAKSRIYIAPKKMWLTLDAGRFTQITYNTTSGTLTLSLEPATKYAPNAYLRIDTENQLK